ncbi:hypothetical protein BDK51DRAFT_46086 [Blyttiomyces helicus]|uniref:Uncharacterized protein n=1 Tax=Blyttiomyces helicus TaxID=388810 RepID=A0A4P9WF50_9FUNG|nr:hypothetical protein BDK51DRAFT_46086 [Blyttiomyces helicus]|eukprot:RKO91032.1 hypothetical protein BDK51DRAFT_46086 [Blyttiomyces helicus]
METIRPGCEAVTPLARTGYPGYPVHSGYRGGSSAGASDIVARPTPQLAKPTYPKQAAYEMACQLPPPRSALPSPRKLQLPAANPTPLNPVPLANLLHVKTPICRFAAPDALYLLPGFSLSPQEEGIQVTYQTIAYKDQSIQQVAFVLASPGPFALASFGCDSFNNAIYCYGGENALNSAGDQSHSESSTLYVSQLWGPLAFQNFAMLGAPALAMNSLTFVQDAGYIFGVPIPAAPNACETEDCFLLKTLASSGECDWAIARATYRVVRDQGWSRWLACTWRMRATLRWHIYLQRGGHPYGGGSRAVLGDNWWVPFIETPMREAGALRPSERHVHNLPSGTNATQPGNSTSNLVHIFDTLTRIWTLGGTGIDLTSASQPTPVPSLVPPSLPASGIPIVVGSGPQTRPSPHVVVGGVPPTLSSPTGAFSSGDSSSSTNWGAIGGGIGGGLVAILVAIGAVLAIRKRRTSAMDEPRVPQMASVASRKSTIESARPKVDKGKGRATEPEAPERADSAEVVATDLEAGPPPLLERKAGDPVARGPSRSLTFLEREAGGSSSTGPRPR